MFNDNYSSLVKNNRHCPSLPSGSFFLVSKRPPRTLMPIMPAAEQRRSSVFVESGGFGPACLSGNRSPKPVIFYHPSFTENSGIEKQEGEFGMKRESTLSSAKTETQSGECR